MSILGSIFSKILGHHGATPADAAPGSTSTTPSPTRVSDTVPTPPAPAGASASTPPATASASPAPGTAPAPPTAPATVDVAVMLDGVAAKSGQTFDWRHSIVDMMKLLGLDSALSARQALAKELHYTGDLHDSASMNIWLHKQVMTKLAQNGGVVPDDLKA